MITWSVKAACTWDKLSRFSCRCCLILIFSLRLQLMRHILSEDSLITSNTWHNEFNWCTWESRNMCSRSTHSVHKSSNLKNSYALFICTQSTPVQKYCMCNVTCICHFLWHLCLKFQKSIFSWSRFSNFLTHVLKNEKKSSDGRKPVLGCRKNLCVKSS